VRKDDISVELAGQELVVGGEYRQSGAEGRPLRRARREGAFELRMMLPGKADPDEITAALADGVLTVTVPKAEIDKPRRIEVTAG
jgi:HSP20 family protein